VRDATETDEGLVWIWNESLDEWYCFNGIYAKQFSHRNGEILFVDGQYLRQFNPIYYIDDGEDYTAYYESGYLGASRADSIKRALRAVFCVQSKGRVLLCDLETEQASYQFSFAGENTQAPELFDMRAAPGRFRFLRYRISSAENVPTRIYRANFYTKL